MNTRSRLVYKNESGITHVVMLLIAGMVIVGGATFGYIKVRNANKLPAEKQYTSNNTINIPGDPPAEETEDTSDKETPEVAGNKIENGRLSIVATPYYVVIPSGWKLEKSVHVDYTEDSVDETGRYELTKGDYKVSINSDQGGFGGGPGCYFSDETAESSGLDTKCPHYKLLSSVALIEDYKFARIQADFEDRTEYCSIIANSERLENSFKEAYPENDMWTCFSQISLAGNPKTENNQALSLRIVISNSTNGTKITSTDIANAAYLEAESIIKSLSK